MKRSPHVPNPVSAELARIQAAGGVFPGFMLDRVQAPQYGMEP